MKAILVPVEMHPAARFPVELAAFVAKRFAASVEGFALRRPPHASIGWDPADVAMISSAPWTEPFSVTEARALFDACMDRQGIAPAGTGSTGAASRRWNDKATGGEEFLGSQARAFDLTVVGQPTAGGKGAAITTLEAALFEGGGPILIAPARPLAGLGRRIVIVWNGSSETARTIAFAMPLLRDAERVLLLADDGGLKHAPSGARICERLAQNAVSADLKVIGGGGVRSGDTLLREAAAFGCDLLVKGAYTQSRLRQMIFGGATSHILAEAEIPVFTAH